MGRLNKNQQRASYIYKRLKQTTMKKIITLLLAAGAFTGVFAQSGQHSSSYGNKPGTVVQQKSTSYDDRRGMEQAQREKDRCHPSRPPHEDS
jgi:hypothetical protein